MRGHVRKKNNRYYIVLELDKDPVTGKRNQKWISPQKEFNLPKPPNKKECDKLLIDYLKQLNDGTYIESTDITLGDWLTRWLSEHGRSLKPTTVASYETIIKLHILPEIGHIPLAKLKPAHLQILYDEKLSHGRLDGRPGGLSSRVVNYIHQIIRKALDKALKIELVSRNVALSTDPPKVKSEKRTSWTADDAKTFLKAVEGHSYSPVYLLILYAGLRRGEALGLQWRDIESTKNTIHISRSLVMINGKTAISDGKTLAAHRTIAVSHGLISALLSRKESDAKINDFVCVTPIGTPVYPRNLNRHFKNTIERLGLPSITIHDMRHTHASLLLAAGEQIKVVSERLGHSRASITMDIYAHVLPGQQEKAAKRIADILSD